MIRQGQMLNLKDISDILCVDIIGAVCDDEQVVISTNNGNPLAGTATVAGQAIRENLPQAAGRRNYVAQI